MPRWRFVIITCINFRLGSAEFTLNDLLELKLSAFDKDCSSLALVRCRVISGG